MPVEVGAFLPLIEIRRPNLFKQRTTLVPNDNDDKSCNASFVLAANLP